jgi:hypothetical protein
MNRPPLRLARPGQLPAPATGDDSLHVLTEAIGNLARQRTPYWLGDSSVHLHALASLIAQAEQLLPQAVADARDQELTWTQIGELLGTTTATAARRYKNKP